ncbi:DUF4259 domain-containing protein [Dactylosporangium sp. CA-233914]|uniref:DUF4259 domain-containing protein n=1 Tax=Dactylosporangium sp. CA-233914 TaxID=3239934 RepID=UPI003D8F6142
MGTWGSGNFGSDTAADHLSILTERLVREVEDAMAGDPVELEPDEYWGVAVPCNLEILYLLAGQSWVGVVLPEVETVEAWKATFLAVWDASIDGLEPTPQHKAQRRAVLERTFDQLAAAIRAR